MKKQILILIIGMLLITTIIAGGVTIASWSKEKALTTDTKEFLKMKPNEELSFSIDLKCLEDKCYYNIKGDLINIQDEMSRYKEICIHEYIGKGWSACDKWETKQLTEEEMQEEVSQLVLDKLSNYINNEITKSNPEITSKGSLTLK